MRFEGENWRIFISVLFLFVCLFFVDTKCVQLDLSVQEDRQGVLQLYVCIATGLTVTWHFNSLN